MNHKLEEQEIKILNYLISINQTTYQDIANHLNISVKTVGKYIDGLQEFLKDVKTIELTVKSGYGVMLEGDLEALRSVILTIGYGSGSIKDREIHVYSKFLNTNGFLKIQDLADELFVSRTTMENTIKVIRIRLEKLGVKLISSRQGLKIDASEKKKRQLMADITQYYWGGVLASNSKKEEVELGVQLIGSNKDLFDTEIMQEIVQILNCFIDQSDLEVTEYEYQTLAIHLAIAVERIKKEFYVKKEIPFKESVSQYTKLLVNLLEQQFNIELPDFEKEYIDIHIIAIERNSLNDINKEKVQLLDYNEQLIQLIQKQLVMFAPDEELLNSLVVHLNAAIKRLQLGLSIRNPYVEKIKADFSGAFIISSELTKIIEKKFNIVINEDEIAYISLHIQSFFDREEKTTNEVILVCSSGYGTSKLLEQKIKRQFGDRINIKQVIGIRDLRKIKINDELIISTIPITNLTSPLVVVSPLMTVRDMKNIELVINKQQKNSKKIFMDLTAEKFCIISEKNNETRNQVLEKITQQLIVNGVAIDGIYKSALLREQISSTALDEYAMPHAEISYVSKPVVFIYINKKGIDWGGKMVKLIFFFALNEQVKESLNYIYEFFNEITSNKQIMKEFSLCKDYQDVESILGGILSCDE